MYINEAQIVCVWVSVFARAKLTLTLTAPLWEGSLPNQDVRELNYRQGTRAPVGGTRGIKKKYLLLLLFF